MQSRRDGVKVEMTLISLSVIQIAFYTRLAKGRERQRFTQRMLEEKKGEIDFNYIKLIMRRHVTDPNYHPPYGLMKNICMLGD